MAQDHDDHDSPWKEALEVFLPQCLALFAPDLHAIIDSILSHPIDSHDLLPPSKTSGRTSACALAAILQAGEYAKTGLLFGDHDGRSACLSFFEGARRPPAFFDGADALDATADWSIDGR